MFFRSSRQVLPVEPSGSSGRAVMFFRSSRQVLPVEPSGSSGRAVMFFRPSRQVLPAEPRLRSSRGTRATRVLGQRAQALTPGWVKRPAR